MVYSKAFEEELFYRFEHRVDVRSFGGDFKNLLLAMRWFLRRKQNGNLTGRQMRALADVAERMGFVNIPEYIWYGEVRQPQKRVVSVSTRKRKWKRKIRVTKVQKSVRYYVKKGYSANKIQRVLKKRGLGIQRKTLLRYVREAKGKTVKADNEKYIPKKYRGHRL